MAKRVQEARSGRFGVNIKETEEGDLIITLFTPDKLGGALVVSPGNRATLVWALDWIKEQVLEREAAGSDGVG